MTRTITGLFDTYEAAKTAVDELRDAGVPEADISLVASDAEGRHDVSHRHDGPAAGEPGAVESDARTGAGVGAVVGGTGGLLAGLGMLAIPGIGPVVAAGWVVTTIVGALAGAAAGGAAGGLVGALTHAGVPEEKAHLYAEGVRRGGSLVTAKVDEDLADEAEAILDRAGSVDAAARGEAWRQNGWTGFDDRAPAYSAEQAQQERQARLASNPSGAPTGTITDSAAGGSIRPRVDQRV